MAARKVQLKDNSGNKAYPVTSSACVGMSDGSGNLDDYVKKFEARGYLLAGIATPSTNPGVPDGNVFYLATTAGTYTNFGGLSVEDGELAILKYDGTWSKDKIDISTGKNEKDISSIKFTDGFGIVADINNETYGNGIPNNTITYSEYVECENFDRIELSMPTWDKDTIVGLVFYDSGKTAIKQKGYNYIFRNTGEYGVENVSINIPSGAYYFRTTYWKDTETYGNFKAILKKISIEDIQGQLIGVNEIVDSLYKKEGITDYVDCSDSLEFKSGYYLIANDKPGAPGYDFGKEYSNLGTSVSNYLSIKNNYKIEISVFQSNTSTDNGCVIYDSNKNPIKGYRFQNTGSEKKNIVATLNDIPASAAYLRTSVISGDEAYVFRYKKINVSGIIPDLDERLSKLEGNSAIILNIKDYGAEDGGNVKTIIRDMLDILESNGGGTIYAPKGTYLLEEPVRWKSNVNLIGDGLGLTIFKPTSNQSAFVGDEIGNFTFEKFTIDGTDQQKNSTIAYAKGIFQTKLTNVTYKDLEIKNTSATGLGTDYFVNGIIENVRCDNCGRDASFTTSSGAAGCSGIGIGVGGFKRGNETLTILNCHCNNCGQYGIFVEQQTQVGGDASTGTSIIGCTAEGNRTGFGVSGGDSTIFIACTAYNNHHAGFAYDSGTMGLNSTGKRPKYIGCVASNNGKNIPGDYPEYLGQKNGFGWYILQNYQGVELISCNSINNLKSGIEVVNGITGLNISGGEISGNGEHGIDLNGNISNFKISPTLIQYNTADGIRINASLSKGLIKGISITKNNNGINKTDNGSIGDSIINENFVYSNTSLDSNISQ